MVREPFGNSNTQELLPFFFCKLNNNDNSANLNHKAQGKNKDNDEYACNL